MVILDTKAMEVQVSDRRAVAKFHRNEDRWLSVQEIAKHLGVSRDTVYTWVNEKHMPAHKVGKLWKFNKAEVDAWVRSGKAHHGDKATE